MLFKLRKSYPFLVKHISFRFCGCSAKTIHLVTPMSRLVNVNKRKICMEKNTQFSQRIICSKYSTVEITEEVDDRTYEKVCNETLESLTDCFEEMIEQAANLQNADVAFSDGVLTVNLGSNIGTYVINRQSHNKQIWLSSPVSGPKRYDFLMSKKQWVYKHNGQTLHSLLQKELTKTVNGKVDFSKCLFSKI